MVGIITILEQLFDIVSKESLNLHETEKKNPQ
jgi:hypothetical protein